MPFYSYRCHTCKSDFTVKHGMFFEQTRCIKCHCNEGLEKIIAPVMAKKKKEAQDLKPGATVKRHIEEYREELKTMKDDAKKAKV